MAALMAASAWLWVSEIGGDLRESDRFSAGHGASSALAGAPRVGGRLAGGPAAELLPGPRAPSPTSLSAPMDPARRALLATARDLVARSVRPARFVVGDEARKRAHAVDLVRVALGQVDFPLLAAIAAHKLREPGRYGLAGRTAAASDRNVDVGDVASFLAVHAEPISADDDRAWRAGDVVWVGRRGAADSLAVVAEHTDARGVSLLYTLDVRDDAARADRSLRDYQIRGVWRVHASTLERAIRTLGLRPAAPGVTG